MTRITYIEWLQEYEVIGGEICKHKKSKNLFTIKEIDAGLNTVVLEAKG
jgi:hypothetical protein